MSKARRKNTPVIPQSCVFAIPTPYQQTTSGERFLLMDYFVKRAKKRVLIFSSDQQLDVLFNSDVIFVDGTFSTAPEHFEQVFLIHVQQFNQGRRIVYYLITINFSSTSKRFASGILLITESSSINLCGIISAFDTRSDDKQQNI